jgi:hypothetical protein
MVVIPLLPPVPVPLHSLLALTLPSPPCRAPVSVRRASPPAGPAQEGEARLPGHLLLLLPLLLAGPPQQDQRDGPGGAGPRSAHTNAICLTLRLPRAAIWRGGL